MRVQCPLCKKKNFVLTEKYDPKALPNGAMVRWVGPFPHIDWLMASTTLWSAMTCPECCAQLAPSGRFTVVLEAGETTLPQVPIHLVSDDTIAVKADVEIKDIKINDIKSKVKMEKDEDGNYACKICGLKYDKPMQLVEHSKTHKMAFTMGA